MPPNRVRMMIQGERFDGQYKGDRMFYALENPDEPERTIIQVRQYAMAGRNEDGDGGYGGIFLPREIIIIMD